jgi:hypothetical protein
MADQVRTVRRRGASAELGMEDRLAYLEERLRDMEGAPGLRERGRHLMDRVMPPEASKHFRNAGREQLLGVRSIVDHWIRRLDEADTRADRRTGDRETIQVE